jgi:hypothetical protein
MAQKYVPVPVRRRVTQMDTLGGRQAKAVCRKALAQAKEGNAAAREWLEKYLMPNKPAGPLPISLALLAKLDQIDEEGFDAAGLFFLETGPHNPATMERYRRAEKQSAEKQT